MAQKRKVSDIATQRGTSVDDVLAHLKKAGIEVVDVDLPVDDLDARLLEVGENVIDARPSLGRDIGDLAFLRHSPHRLSSLVCRATARRTAGSRTAGPRKARANARRLSAASRHVCSGHR